MLSKYVLSLLSKSSLPLSSDMYSEMGNHASVMIAGKTVQLRLYGHLTVADVLARSLIERITEQPRLQARIYWLELLDSYIAAIAKDVDLPTAEASLLTLLESNEKPEELTLKWVKTNQASITNYLQQSSQCLTDLECMMIYCALFVGMRSHWENADLLMQASSEQLTAIAGLLAGENKTEPSEQPVEEPGNLTTEETLGKLIEMLRSS